MRSALPVRSVVPALALAALTACAGSSSSGTAASPSPATNSSVTPAVVRAPSPDPRVGLKAGWFNPGEASWNLKVVSKTKPSADFLNMSTPGDRRLINSDLAFSSHYVYQGNYSGYQVWDVSNPAKPVLATSYVCPGSQSDVTVYHNLMFVSAEAVTGRNDCGLQGVEDTVSHDRARGIRIFDITDVKKPKPITIVQTCRGSHTNTLVTDPNDKANVYIYVSGSAGVRSPKELPGCSDKSPDEDPNSALFRIEVIQIPLAHPEQAKIVSSPRIFQDMASGKAEGVTRLPRHGENPADSAETAQRMAAAAAAGAAPARARPNGITQCHDITAYPAVGLAGGACSGAGLLLDIRDVKNPKRVDVALDSNFSAWHSATFSNDGSQVLFSDEWGGGSQPRCRATDNKAWGADAIFTISADKKMTFHSYYKLPAPQTPEENCVSHNGSPVPVPGREILVQGWYQGGVSVFDWTDPSHPYEIAYYDMGPMDATKMISAGYWSVYWYNGYIYGSELSRGMDVFALTPNANLTQNEIDASNLVKLNELNVQDQPQFSWPAAFPVARAYLDQLIRGNGISSARQAGIKASLDAAQKLSGAAQKTALQKLGSELDADAASASDKARVKALAGVVKQMGK